MMGGPFTYSSSPYFLELNNKGTCTMHTLLPSSVAAGLCGSGKTDIHQMSMWQETLLPARKPSVVQAQEPDSRGQS